jgi:hypothetical protein
MLCMLKPNWIWCVLDMCVLQAHCHGLPVAAVERYQLLQAAVAMLPGGVQSAHAEELLQRHHHEHLEPQVLKQVGTRTVPWGDPSAAPSWGDTFAAPACSFSFYVVAGTWPDVLRCGHDANSTCCGGALIAGLAQGDVAVPRHGHSSLRAG